MNFILPYAPLLNILITVLVGIVLGRMNSIHALLMNHEKRITRIEERCKVISEFHKHESAH